MPLIRCCVREMPGWFLDTLERILAPIDAASPVRLPTKVKAFRTLTTDTELLEQRAELLIGSMMARGGVSFEFGKDHPRLRPRGRCAWDRGGLAGARWSLGIA
jgi:hypothetical protein